MLERINTLNHPALQEIQDLYESAFPAHEKRAWAKLLELLSEPHMFLNAIMKDHQFLGFMIFWQLQKWTYIEHFAIKPALRSKKYGEKTIAYLKRQAGAQLILETDPPIDELSQRRVRFYERLGLVKIDFAYFQPPYRKNEEPFPMLLMSTETLEKDEFEEVNKLLRYEIYERFY